MKTLQDGQALRMTFTSSQTGNGSGVCFSILTSITPCKSQCQEMTFNYNPIGQDQEAVNTAKYPGVDLSNDLSWNSHIDRTAKKANSMLGFLQRNLRIDYNNIKAVAYKTLV